MGSDGVSQAATVSIKPQGALLTCDGAGNLPDAWIKGPRKDTLPNRTFEAP